VDTGTVLSIIEMIDKKILDLDADETMHQEEYHGARKILIEVIEHLQSFIEGQLNALDSQTGE